MKKSRLGKFLSGLVFLPLGLALIVFAVVNRHSVVMEFWPLPIDISAPVSLVVMITLITGVFWGGVVSWLTNAHSRRQGREFGRRARLAEAEIGQLKDKVSKLQTELNDSNRSKDVNNGSSKASVHAASNMA